MIGKNGWYFAGCLSVCNIFDATKPRGNRCQEKLEQQVEKFNKKKDQVHRPGMTVKSIISVSGLPGQPFDWESPNMLRWIAWVKQEEASFKKHHLSEFSVTILLNSLLWTALYFGLYQNKNSKISSSVGFKGPMRASRFCLSEQEVDGTHPRTRSRDRSASISARGHWKFSNMEKGNGEILLKL